MVFFLMKAKVFSFHLIKLVIGWNSNSKNYKNQKLHFQLPPETINCLNNVYSIADIDLECKIINVKGVQVGLLKGQNYNETIFSFYYMY